jgi:hypothetical protein
LGWCRAPLICHVIWILACSIPYTCSNLAFLANNANIKSLLLKNSAYQNCILCIWCQSWNIWSVFFLQKNL